MPLYYFHTDDDGTRTYDIEGTELSCRDEAHSQAMTASGEMIRDIDGKFRSGRWHMRVVDDDGDMVSNIVVTVERGGSA